MVWSRFLSWEIYLRHVDEAESGDIYLTYMLVYFVFRPQASQAHVASVECTYVVYVHSVESGKILSIK